MLGDVQCGMDWGIEGERGSFPFPLSGFEPETHTARWRRMSLMLITSPWPSATMVPLSMM